MCTYVSTKNELKDGTVAWLTGPRCPRVSTKNELKGENFEGGKEEEEKSINKE